MSNVVRFPVAGEREPRQRDETPRGPQVEDGYTRVANELLEQVIAAPFTQREMRVVLAVIRLTYGWNRKTARVTGGLLAKITGLHDSRCTKILASLIEKRVILRHGGSRSPVSLNKHADQWLLEAPNHTPPSPKSEGAESAQNEPSQSAQIGPASKDRKDMNTSSYEDESTAGADDAPSGDQDLAESKGDTAPRQQRKAKAQALPHCPHQAILDQWEAIMPEKRQPLRSLWAKGTGGSRDLAVRWKQGFGILNDATGEPLYTDEASGIAWWGKFFRFLRRSEFLMRDENRWFGLDWVCKADNFRKIMELKYHPELAQGEGGEA